MPAFRMPRVTRRDLVLTLGLFLAACATQPPSPSPSAAPPSEMSARERAASQVHVAPADAASLISHYRQAHGLSAVTPDPTLQQLAQAQADAMATRNVLSHTIAGTMNERFDAAGLAGATAVENVSAGYFSLSAVLDGWQKSPPHNANLLSPKMRHLGLATAYAPGTRYLLFWALDMSD